MNVFLAGYQAISILHGGPNSQLRNTAKFLPQYDVNPKMFDPWASFSMSDCDVFHLFAANIGTYHLAREIHSLGIPLVVSPITYSLHSHTFVKAMLNATRLLQRFGKGVWSDYALTADICTWAGRLLPNTRAEAALLSRGLGISSAKITVVQNGVDERFYRADPSLFKKKYGLEDFILSVGHTGHARKNVLALIKALAQIDHPSVIIGRIIKGSYGDACQREAAKYRHIKLIDGLQNDSEMLSSAYAACDVFVLPSLFETPGIAALEAGLAGAKIVITEFGGTKEYFGNMATYVNPRSIDSIRKGITKSLESKKSSTLREHIKKEFLWSRVAERTAAAYRSVLSSQL